MPNFAQSAKCHKTQTKTRLGIPIQNKAKASQLSYLQQQWGKKSNSKELDKQSKKNRKTLSSRRMARKEIPRKKTAIVISAPIFHIFAAIKIIKSCTIMNEQEKNIIEAIIDKGNRRKHDRALISLLYGDDIGITGDPFKYKKDKGDIPYILQDIIRKYYSKIRFEDAYSVFASDFMLHLDRMPAEMLRDIDDLKSWIFITARNFAIDHKKEIESLGEIETGITIAIDDSRMYGESPTDDEAESYDAVKKESTETEKDSEDDEETNYESNDEFGETNDGENQDGEDPFDETPDAEKSRIGYYLSKINNAYYRDLIRAIKIEGIDREVLARQYGKDVADINRDFSRAWIVFITVALDDIQQCRQNLFKKYENHKDLNDENACLLRDFLQRKQSMQNMVIRYGMTEAQMKEKLAIAFKLLLKIDKKEREKEEEEKQKEEKKLHRMKRLWGLYKGIVKVNNHESYNLLSRYFNECKSDYSLLLGWALNNNINVSKLEQQLEDSFGILDAINKERYNKKNNHNDEDNNK